MLRRGEEDVDTDIESDDSESGDYDTENALDVEKGDK